MSETELKFALDGHSAAVLRQRLSQLDATDTPAERRMLHSIYFDTKKHRLKKAGIALRVRQIGETWVQTVKAKAENRGGLQRAEESEADLADGAIDLSAIDDKSLRKFVKSALGGKALHAVCETKIDRTAALMHGPSGATVEVALDEGRIIAGEASRPFQELELELKAGNVGALYDLAEQLLPGGAEPSQLSKSERGYLLAATGEIDKTTEPRPALVVPIDAQMSAGTAAKAIFRECAAQVFANVAVIRQSDDPEDPHQLRIGLRRLRSGFELFQGLLHRSEIAQLKAEAKWIGGVVGRQRDLDVAIQDLLIPAAKKTPNAGFDALIETAKLRAADHRVMLRDVLDSQRTQRFLIALGRFTETSDWDALDTPVIRLARRSLRKSWKQAAARAKGIASLNETGRHELRKSLKKVRYQIEFVGPLFSPKKVGRFLKPLKALQQLFGDLNDLAMLKALYSKDQGLCPNTSDAQAALRTMLAQGEKRADDTWLQARSLWRALAKTPRFWQAEKLAGW